MNASLLISTTNPGKIREFTELLEDYPIEVLSPADFDLPIVEENGKSFAENAIKKATEYAKATNKPCLADDSGIGIDALLGQPGIFSARWANYHDIKAPEGQEDAANRQLILQQLNRNTKISTLERTGRFICVVCFAFPDGRHFTSEGRLEGLVTTEERGQFGFGYDPIFQPINHIKTMAELRPAIKNQISHRSKAIRKILPVIVKELTGETI